jgi:hypothetical protein
VQAIGVAVLATVLVSTISPEVRAAAELAGQTGSDPRGLCDTAANWHEGRMELSVLACYESLAGFDRAYGLTTVFALVALALGATLPGWPGPWHGRTGPPAHAA